MKTYWGVEVELHTFLTFALDGGKWSAMCPGHFYLEGKSPLVPTGYEVVIMISIQFILKN
jgi:hypothetical protein